MEALAGLYGRFEQPNRQLAEIDKKFYCKFGEMDDFMGKASEAAASRVRCIYRRLATTVVDADVELNEGLDHAAS